MTTMAERNPNVRSVVRSWKKKNQEDKSRKKRGPIDAPWEVGEKREGAVGKIKKKKLG